MPALFCTLLDKRFGHGCLATVRTYKRIFSGLGVQKFVTRAAGIPSARHPVAPTRADGNQKPVLQQEAQPPPQGAVASSFDGKPEVHQIREHPASQNRARIHNSNPRMHTSSHRTIPEKILYVIRNAKMFRNLCQLDFGRLAIAQCPRENTLMFVFSETKQKHERFSSGRSPRCARKPTRVIH